MAARAVAADYPVFSEADVTSPVPEEILGRGSFGLVKRCLLRGFPACKKVRSIPCPHVLWPILSASWLVCCGWLVVLNISN